MFRSDHGSFVRLEVGRTRKGRTAQTRMDRASVQPPNLVQPSTTRTHRGARTRTHTRARVCLYVRQGKGVRQIKDWCGFAPSDLSSDLSLILDEAGIDYSNGCNAENQPTKGNEMSTILKDPDNITSEDLPGWRAEMCAQIENGNFSDTFHAACQNVIAAIDQARDEDETTHAPLKAALEEYMRIGKYELLLHNSCVGALPC